MIHLCNVYRFFLKLSQIKVIFIYTKNLDKKSWSNVFSSSTGLYLFIFDAVSLFVSLEDNQKIQKVDGKHTTLYPSKKKRLIINETQQKS